MVHFRDIALRTSNLAIHYLLREVRHHPQVSDTRFGVDSFHDLLIQISTPYGAVPFQNDIAE
jgi:hypothetical protein